MLKSWFASVAAWLALSPMRLWAKIFRFPSRLGKAAPGRVAVLASAAKGMATLKNKRAETEAKRRWQPGLFSPASSPVRGYFARISHGENTFAHDGG